MPVFIGFNTLDVCQEDQTLSDTITGGLSVTTPRQRTGKKFRLTDSQLVIRDFINSLNIRKGDKVGRPEYGTILWEYLFDPNTVELSRLIEEEIRRVAGLDPRLNLGNLSLYARDNGILVEMDVRIIPFNNIVQVGILLDNKTGSVSLVF